MLANWACTAKTTRCRRVAPSPISECPKGPTGVHRCPLDPLQIRTADRRIKARSDMKGLTQMLKHRLRRTKHLF